MYALNNKIIMKVIIKCNNRVSSAPLYNKRINDHLNRFVWRETRPERRALSQEEGSVEQLQSILRKFSICRHSTTNVEALVKAPRPCEIKGLYRCLCGDARTKTSLHKKKYRCLAFVAFALACAQSTHGHGRV